MEKNSVSSPKKANYPLEAIVLWMSGTFSGRTLAIFGYTWFLLLGPALLQFLLLSSHKKTGLQLINYALSYVGLEKYKMAPKSPASFIDLLSNVLDKPYFLTFLCILFVLVGLCCLVRGLNILTSKNIIHPQPWSYIIAVILGVGWPFATLLPFVKHTYLRRFFLLAITLLHIIITGVALLGYASLYLGGWSLFTLAWLLAILFVISFACLPDDKPLNWPYALAPTAISLFLSLTMFAMIDASTPKQLFRRLEEYSKMPLDYNALQKRKNRYPAKASLELEAFLHTRLPSYSNHALTPSSWDVQTSYCFIQWKFNGVSSKEISEEQYRKWDDEFTENLAKVELKMDAERDAYYNQLSSFLEQPAFTISPVFSSAFSTIARYLAEQIPEQAQDLDRLRAINNNMQLLRQWMLYNAQYEHSAQFINHALEIESMRQNALLTAMASTDHPLGAWLDLLEAQPNWRKTHIYQWTSFIQLYPNLIGNLAAQNNAQYRPFLSHWFFNFEKGDVNTFLLRLQQNLPILMLKCCKDKQKVQLTTLLQYAIQQEGDANALYAEFNDKYSASDLQKLPHGTRATPLVKIHNLVYRMAEIEDTDNAFHIAARVIAHHRRKGSFPASLEELGIQEEDFRFIFLANISNSLSGLVIFPDNSPFAQEVDSLLGKITKPRNTLYALHKKKKTVFASIMENETHTLFSNLSDTEASSIVDKLNKMYTKQFGDEYKEADVDASKFNRWFNSYYGDKEDEDDYDGEDKANDDETELKHKLKKRRQPLHYGKSELYHYVWESPEYERYSPYDSRNYEFWQIGHRDMFDPPSDSLFDKRLADVMFESSNHWYEDSKFSNGDLFGGPSDFFASSGASEQQDMVFGEGVDMFGGGKKWKSHVLESLFINYPPTK